MPLDQAKLDEFAGKMLNDMGAAATGAMVLIGDKLGLYKALAAEGPLAPAELAAQDRHSGALCPRMAGGTGGGGVCPVSARDRHIRHDRRTGHGPGG